MSVFLPLNALPPAAALLTLPKMLAAALAPYTGSGVIMGVALALLAERHQLTRRKNGENNVRSLGFGTLTIVVAGLAATTLSLYCMLRVTAPHEGFERAFGANWQSKISPELSSGMLAKRWTWQLPGAALLGEQAPPALRRLFPVYARPLIQFYRARRLHSSVLTGEPGAG